MKMKLQEREDSDVVFVLVNFFYICGYVLLILIIPIRKSRKLQRTSNAEPREADRSSSNNQRKDMRELSRLFTVDRTDLARASRTEVAAEFELSTLLSTTTSSNKEGAVCE